jgi:23S rRNA (uracil747-C5)-methyltransferase
MADLDCLYFKNHQCRSCSLANLTDSAQQQLKTTDLKRRLEEVGYRGPIQEAAPSAPLFFRHRAKMAVGGDLQQPLLGFSRQQEIVDDLSGCPLHTWYISRALPRLKTMITEFKLFPYQLKTRQGELKNIILQQSFAFQELMIRFVLRSTEAIPRVKKMIPVLQEEMPQIKIVSCNLQPAHQAILEGAEEVILTEQKTLLDRWGDIELEYGPQAFLQTNPAVAIHLYEFFRQQVQEFNIYSLWDLYCGIGPFSLFAGKNLSEHHGIELSGPAVETARKNAQHNGMKNLNFTATKVRDFCVISRHPPQAVILNPPRRGAGEILGPLTALNIPYLFYSSCNAESLGQDLRELLPHYKIVSAKLFDMFPWTEHYETLLSLKKL